MGTKKLLAGLMAFVMVFGGAAVLPVGNFGSSAIVVSAAEYTKGREFDGKRNENYVKAKFDVECEVFLVDIDGKTYPVSGTVTKTETQSTLVDTIDMPIAEYKELASKHKIIAATARVTVKDMQDDKSYMLSSPSVSAASYNPDNYYSSYSESAYADSASREPNIGCTDSDGVWHDDVIGTSYGSLSDIYIGDNDTAMRFTVRTNKSSMKIVDMSADDAKVKPANRPVLSPVEKKCTIKNKCVLEYYVTDADGKKYKLENQPKQIETDRYIYNEFEYDLDEVSKVLDKNKIVNMQATVTVPDLKEGTAVYVSPMVMTSDQTYRTDEYERIDYGYESHYGMLGDKDSDGNLIKSTSETVYTQGIQTMKVMTIVDKWAYHEYDNYTPYQYSNVEEGENVEMPYDFESEFFLIDSDGNYIPVKGDISRSEENAVAIDKLTIPYDEYKKLVEGKEIYGTAARISVKDMADDKSYYLGTGYASTEYVYSEDSSYAHASTSYSTTLKKENEFTPNIACVGEDGKWHDDKIIYTIGGPSEPWDEEKVEGVTFSATIFKYTMEMGDMSKEDAAAKPANRPALTDLSTYSKELETPLVLEYYAVDFDENYHKLKTQPEPTENGRYLVSELKVTPDMIAEVCPLDEFKYLALGVSAPELGENDTITPSVRRTTKDEVFKPVEGNTDMSPTTGSSYVSSRYSIGSVDEDGNLVTTVYYRMDPVVASRIEELESVTLVNILDKFSNNVIHHEPKSDDGKKTDDKKTDDKKDDSKTDDKTDDSKTDDKKDDSKTDDKTDDSKADDKTDDSKADDKTDDSKADDKKDDSKTDDKSADDSKSDDKESTSGEDKTADGVKGDINGDGIVNVTDISLVAGHVKGKKALEGDAEKWADVNGDGSVNVADISKIAAHVKGVKELV